MENNKNLDLEIIELINNSFFLKLLIYSKIS